jgi:hypothetical protein
MKEQEREKIKAMNLHGEELFEYCRNSNDRELWEDTKMILCASRDKEKTIKYLERIVYNNETLIYYYPMLYRTAKALAKAKKQIKGKESIGGILDGGLYI